MARSSDMSTTMQYVKYYITCTQSSQNVTNNTSNVTVSVSVYRTNSGYPTWGTGTMYVNINGTNYTSSITTNHVFDSAAVTVFQKNLDIPHNADGTKVLSMSAYVSHSMFTSSSQSYSQTLTTIARKSKPTLSASSTEMNSVVTINTNRASSSFTHTLKYVFGSSSGTIATGVTTSHSWTVPLALANQIPNATSGTGTITLETYNGATLLGSNNVTFTATVPTSVVPSFTGLGVARVDGNVPSAWGIYVRGKSRATLTINGAVGSYSSTISSYSISGGGYSTTNSSFTTGFLNSSGTITFTGTIKDSRGRTASKTASVTVIDYTNPNISSFTSFRANSGGTALDTGTYLRCATTFTYSSVSSKNTIGANIKFRKVGVTTWTTGSNITSGTAITTGGGTISIDSSYEVLLTVTDAFGSTTKTLPISTSAVMLDFKSGGKGVAIGKVSETDNLFDVGWSTNINGKLTATVIEVRGEGTPYIDFSNDATTDYDARLILVDNDTLRVDGANLSNSNWFETTGASGWRNTTYGGGWHMSDATWIRTSGGKDVYVNAMLRADGGFQVGSNGSETNIDSVGYVATKIVRTNKLEGRASLDQINLGNTGACRLDTAGGIMRLYTTGTGTSDCGLQVDTRGGVNFRTDGVIKHAFNTGGTKTGGTMEVEGTTYGMSPIDSPQTLIEYVIYDEMVEEEKTIYLDEIYRKMVSKYSVFCSNRNIDIEKYDEYFIIKGTGITDINIKGQRKEEQEYFKIMGGFENGTTEEVDSQ